MDKPVAIHIRLIKNAIAEFTAELDAATDPLQKHTLQSDIRELSLALQHYELALEIEEKVFKHRKQRGA